MKKTKLRDFQVKPVPTGIQQTSESLRDVGANHETVAAVRGSLHRFWVRRAH